MGVRTIQSFDTVGLMLAASAAVGAMENDLAVAHRDLIHAEMFPGHALLTGALKAGLKTDGGKVTSEETYWFWPLERPPKNKPNYPGPREIVSKTRDVVVQRAVEVVAESLGVFAHRASA